MRKKHFNNAKDVKNCPWKNAMAPPKNVIVFALENKVIAQILHFSDKTFYKKIILCIKLIK